MRNHTPLRNVRRSRTISQAELAKLVGISQQSLSKAERGTLALRWDVKARIAAILGSTPQELFPEAQVTA